ncbi:MAG TPA: ribonuclease HI family protein [Patescibacteria group bacterium]
MKYKSLKVFTDGGARGNPGSAGVGVVVWRGSEVVGQFKKYIGETTNNQAEYQAVILALSKIEDFKPEEVDFYLDSELVVKQLNREYKVRDADLAPLFVKVWNATVNLKKVTFNHIRREKNKEADKLVNQAIDEHLKKK